jgi:thiol-disulfide isomerase/thioredoxin
MADGPVAGEVMGIGGMNAIFKNHRGETMRYLIISVFAGFLIFSGQVRAGGTNMTWTKEERENYKIYRTRADALMEIFHTQPVNWEDFEKGARALVKDFPTRANGYEDLMILMEKWERSSHKPGQVDNTADLDKARALAKEMAEGSVPEKYKTWAKGYLTRLDSTGKPVAMHFTAVDGREVDLAKLKGKVVLIDFWATTCSPCVAELPHVKAVFEKFKAQGFEVIGISCDTDQGDLEKYVKKKGFAWPQYYEGKQQTENKFGQAFGIDGIPHMFLVDKSGKLRFDNVRASGDFEDKIKMLLAE